MGPASACLSTSTTPSQGEVPCDVAAGRHPRGDRPEGKNPKSLHRGLGLNQCPYCRMGSLVSSGKGLSVWLTEANSLPQPA